jgi:hypothetical protein
MKRRLVWFGAGALVAAGVLGPLGTAPAVASKASDTQIAEAGVLVQSDFPAGWTATPRDTSTDAATEKIAKKIPACSDYLALRTATKGEAKAKSEEFSLLNSQVDNTVTVFPTNAGAIAAMKVFARPSVVKCINTLFTKVFTASLESNATTRNQIESIKVKVTPASVEPIADGTTAYEGTVTITTKDGTTQTIGVGNAAVRTGRAIDAFSYVVDTTTVLQLLPSVVDTSVTRLTAALAA